MTEYSIEVRGNKPDLLAEWLVKKGWVIHSTTINNAFSATLLGSYDGDPFIFLGIGINTGDYIKRIDEVS